MLNLQIARAYLFGSDDTTRETPESRCCPLDEYEKNMTTSAVVPLPVSGTG